MVRKFAATEPSNFRTIELFIFADMSEQQARKKIFNFELLRRVFQFAAPYRKKFYTSLVLAIVLAVIAPIRPWLIQITINRGVSGQAKAAPAWLNKIMDSIGGNDLVKLIVLLTLFQI